MYTFCFLQVGWHFFFIILSGLFYFFNNNAHKLQGHATAKQHKPLLSYCLINPQKSDQTTDNPSSFPLPHTCMYAGGGSVLIMYDLGKAPRLISALLCSRFHRRLRGQSVRKNFYGCWLSDYVADESVLPPHTETDESEDDDNGRSHGGAHRHS